MAQISIYSFAALNSSQPESKKKKIPLNYPADESQVYAEPALSQFAIVRWELGIRHLRASGNSYHTIEATTLPQGLRFQTPCLPVLCPPS